MTPYLAHIIRHPIKSHGREELASVVLSEGACLPWDRRWAVAHEAAKIDADAPEWVPCANFSRGAKAPSLMAIDARLDEERRTITLTHPGRAPITFRPDDATDTERFLDWVRPLCPADRAQPARIVSVPGRGMTDTDYPSVSLINLASNAVLGGAMGMKLSPYRWRGNLWLSDLAPWEEFDWIGKRLRIGGAILEVVEPIIRCKATSSNPETGVIDADTLAALRSLRGEQEFGVYARVISGGTIAAGDHLEVL